MFIAWGGGGGGEGISGGKDTWFSGGTEGVSVVVNRV